MGLDLTVGQKGTVPDPDSGNQGKPGIEGLGGKAPMRKVSGTQTLSPSSRNPLPASRRLGDRDSPAQPPSGRAIWAQDEGPPSWPGCPGDHWWDCPGLGRPDWHWGSGAKPGPARGCRGRGPSAPGSLGGSRAGGRQWARRGPGEQLSGGAWEQGGRKGTPRNGCSPHTAFSRRGARAGRAGTGGHPGGVWLCIWTGGMGAERRAGLHTALLPLPLRRASAHRVNHHRARAPGTLSREDFLPASPQWLGIGALACGP